MWKSVVGHNVNVKVASEGDDWETDPDFEVHGTLDLAFCPTWLYK